MERHAEVNEVASVLFNFLLNVENLDLDEEIVAVKKKQNKIIEAAENDISDALEKILTEDQIDSVVTKIMRPKGVMTDFSFYPLVTRHLRLSNNEIRKLQQTYVSLQRRTQEERKELVEASDFDGEYTYSDELYSYWDRVWSDAWNTLDTPTFIKAWKANGEMKEIETLSTFWKRIDAKKRKQYARLKFFKDLE